jgi:deoxyribodipyrimidine photo-lyase
MRGYRIFNPLLQSKKFDPKGEYIRRYVPELAKLSLAAIHEPHTVTVEDQERSGCRIGLDYPAPIVDHQQARQEYLDLGKAAKVGLS